MSTAAATELRREGPAPSSPADARGRGLRYRAAEFWLDLLFRCAARPAITRLMKPLVVSLGFSFSKKIQSSTAFNAQRILDAPTPAQCRAYGRRVLGNFYDFVCDVGLSRRLSMPRLLARIESVQGHSHYVAARALKKGAIIATAHMGSFEIGAAALLQHDHRIHVVFKRDPSRFEQVRAALRRKLGILEAPVDEGLGLWVRLRDVLMRDEVVMVQADRLMPGQRGAKIPFLHGQAMLPTGPVKLALASGAPIVPVFAVRMPDGRIRICVEEAIGVEPSEQSPHPALLKLASVIERYVREYPDQWLMFDRAFCDDVA